MLDGHCLPTPTEAQLAWQDFELGIVYHFDLDVYMPGGHHHEKSRREVVDICLYNPRKLDTDQWLEAAQAMGARYAVFTATHHQGFLQWQTDLYPFGLKQVRWRDGKGDIVRDFVESCHKYGIAPGIYVGTRFNAYWQVYGFLVNGGRGGDQEKQNTYRLICEKMVEELCSRYGQLVEIWFDGGERSPEEGGPDLLPIVRKYQRKIVFYHTNQLREHRWAGNEQGVVPYPCWATTPDISGKPYQGDPNGKYWMPAMADAPIRDHDWLWVPNSEHKLHSVEALVDMYYKSVGRNANLIIGAVPDMDGLIPEPDMARYAEFGREIRRRFQNLKGKISSRGYEIVLALDTPAEIDHVVIMEDIAHGERIRSYVVDGLVGADEWRRLADGISVGHKRIHQIPRIEVNAVRLQVRDAAAEPIIRELSVYG